MLQCQSICNYDNCFWETKNWIVNRCSSNVKCCIHITGYPCRVIIIIIYTLIFVSQINLQQLLIYSYKINSLISMTSTVIGLSDGEDLITYHCHINIQDVLRKLFFFDKRSAPSCSSWKLRSVVVQASSVVLYKNDNNTRKCQCIRCKDNQLTNNNRHKIE